MPPQRERGPRPAAVPAADAGTGGAAASPESEGVLPPAVELPPSDADLVQWMREGDDSAYEELFRRHSEAVRRYARTCCRDAHTADDLTAEVFARTLQAVRGGAGPAHAVRAYLLTTVRRVAAQWTRTQKREHLVEDFAVFAAQASRTSEVSDQDTLDLGAEVRAMHEAEQSLAMQAFRSLPERWQAVLWHTTVEEESPSEVAPLFGLTANATAVLASRAREGLKQAYLQAHVSQTLTAGGDCARYADRLGAYARGGLRMRAERGLRKHLEECARCRLAAGELAHVNAGIPALLPIAVIGWFAAGFSLKAAGVVAGGVAGAAGAGAAAAAAGAGSSTAAGTSAAAAEGLGAPAKAGIAAAVAVAATAGLVWALSGDPQPVAQPEPTPPAVAPVVPPKPLPSPPPRSTPREEAGNIRPRLTSFVGREPELAALRSDLVGSRLVTLTGPGGSGKTRLAEEAARAVPGPAWLVELAPLDDPDAAPGAVLSALRLRETNLITREGQPLQDDPTAVLVDHLADRSLLLVLDNCEHVIEAAAALAETLLTHCPRLRVLATSREPLGVPGETVRPVEPLPPHPAHRLFAERAGAVRPGFDPTEDLGAVDEICRRLDGLPLAIELAAARLRLLSPRQIADRLDDRFQLLTSGSRTVLPRQQTLRAVVDWSWDLLEPEERTLLRQVSVFAGGWDLTAAEALGPGAADSLGALVDKSLVVAAPTEAGAMRYRLLETIHEYAVERAAETPDVLAAAEAAHTAHFTALAEEAEPRLRSGEQLPWIGRIEAELDNIRAALHRAILASDEAAALRLVFAMGWFWWLRNYRSEAVVWVARTVRLGEDPDDPADPRYWPRKELRMLQFFLAAENHVVGDFFADPELLALVRRVREAFGERPGPQAARFPGMLWPFTAYFTESSSDVLAMLDASVDNCRRHGGEWEIGVSLMFRTHMAIDMPGGTPDLDEDLVELRSLSRRVGDRWMRAQVASAAAEANMMRGRHAEAGEDYEEALALAREVGAHAEAPFLIARLAELRYLVGDMDGAEKGLDEAAAEAERHRVNDTETYLRFMRSAIALHRGDVTAARAHLDVAMEHLAASTPPRHFQTLLAGLGARIRAYEGGGDAAVEEAVAALREAREARCADFVTTHLAEGVALALALGGRHAPAVAVLAAADTWRGDTPRAVPELRKADEIATRARAALGEDGYAAAYASGAPLDLDGVAALVGA
ncbi:sigma-70 family RNA polymerase sigma factor [Streptomyces sp. ms191]|nr:sigma-70 family RNA polymerase sigma factor [Streptomyces sp. ms191]